MALEQGESKPVPNNNWWLWLLPVVLVGAGIFGFQVFRRRDPPVDLSQSTIVVSPQAIAIKIRASGTVVPILSVNLSPKIAGKLKELLVEQGDRVKQAQIVAKMDDSSLLPQIEQAQASIAIAQANLERLENGTRTEEIAAAKARVLAAQSRLELSQKRRQRNQSLLAQGAISRDRFDEIEASFRSDQANLQEQKRNLERLANGTRLEEIAQARAQLALEKARKQGIEVQLQDTIVRSPFDGIVTQKFTNVGSFVTPTTSASANSSATSTSIVAVAKGLEILAKVPEVDIGQIAVGQVVEISADAFSDQTFMGKVRLIAPEAVIEQNVTSFQVRISLNTGINTLQSGMNVNVQFIGKQIAQAVVVPTVAIVSQDGKPGVFVADAQGKSEFKPVTLGTTLDTDTQILRGVNAGDRVFIKKPETGN
ncbi:MAG: HlyD family efflux transporter periplasmic adaptor subunit [Pseudanabaenaceae cyanobacterium bins.68]|nr:HlyD family efflux transporter periplasmic adaptor subunit [Pseudanabaenaceae cyanobacterium bins.68]